MAPRDAAPDHDVLAVLAALGDVVNRRDFDGTLALFVAGDDVLLLGSEEGERAFGRAELERFFRHLYARPIGFRWEWDRVEARHLGDVVTFVAEGAVVETSEGTENRTPYRFSGVLVEGQLALLHGSEPAPPKG